MKKNKTEKLLPTLRVPLDRIGSGVNIVNRIFESDEEYPIECENGKYVKMTFNESLEEKKGTIVQLDYIDFHIMYIVRNIDMMKRMNGEKPTFTLTDIVDILYRGNRKSSYFVDMKKRINFLNNTSVTIEYTDCYNDLVKEEERVQKKDRTSLLINLNKESTVTNGIEHINYTILDIPLQFYTELTNRETTVATEGMYSGRITNKRLGIRTYLIITLSSRNIKEVTIEKILKVVNIRKDKNKRYLQDIDKEVKELKEEIERFANIHYRDRNNKKVSNIKDAYKISIKK